MIVRARFRAEDSLPGTPPSPEARALAVAYAIESAIEEGRYRSAAEVARVLGVTRARMSKVLGERWAPVEVQERVLGQRQQGETW